MKLRKLKLTLFICAISLILCNYSFSQNVVKNAQEFAKNKIKKSGIKAETQWIYSPLSDETNQKKTKSIYREYDEYGNTVRQITYSADGNIISDGKFIYDNSGKVTESISKNNVLEGTVRNLYHYTRDDKLSGIETYGEDSKLIADMKYIYNQNGKVEQLITSTADRIVYVVYNYKYDQDDNLSETTVQDINGTIRSKALYEYDNSGNAVREIIYDGKGALLQEKIKKYNNSNKLIDETVKSSKNEIISNTTNKFNEKGFNLEKVVNNPAANFSKKIVFKNDDNGNILEQMVYNKFDEAVSKTIHEYQYYNTDE